MTEYELIERPVLNWLCGESREAYGTRSRVSGLGWTYRDEAAMAVYDRSLDDSLVERILVEKIRLINPTVKTSAASLKRPVACGQTSQRP